MPEHDPFAGTSGLMDDVDFEITEARFGYDPGYDKGNSLVALITMKTDDGEESENFYSVGSGWEESEKGAIAIREDGNDPKGFNRSTNYQRFLMAAMASGGEDVLRGRDANPWEIEKLWVGTRWHGERKQYPGFGDSAEPKEVFVPVAYLGEAGGKKTAAKKSTAKKETPKDDADDAEDNKPAKKVASNGDIPVAVRVKLKKIAKESADHNEFVERIFAGEIDGVDPENDSDVYAVVMDESDEGLFASAGE